MKDALYELFQRVPCKTQDDSNLLTAAGELLDALRAKAAAYDEVMRVFGHMRDNADKFFYCGPEDIDDCELCATRGRIEQLIADERKAGRHVP